MSARPPLPLLVAAPRLGLVIAWLELAARAPRNRMAFLLVCARAAHRAGHRRVGPRHAPLSPDRRRDGGRDRHRLLRDTDGDTDGGLRIDELRTRYREPCDRPVVSLRHVLAPAK